MAMTDSIGEDIVLRCFLSQAQHPEDPPWWHLERAFGPHRDSCPDFRTDDVSQGTWLYPSTPFGEVLTAAFGLGELFPTAGEATQAIDATALQAWRQTVMSRLMDYWQVEPVDLCGLSARPAGHRVAA